ncbi:UNVERIFIED_CONTAM: hypothetical protein RMT77_000785 [Armadillidium vulgare]
MEEMSEDRVNAVTCTAWVPKGVAKHDPEKVEVTKEELAKIIKTTSENLEELERLEESDYSDLEVEALEEELKIPHKKNKKSAKSKNNDVEMEEIDEEKENGNVEEMDEFVKKYNFDTYDSESDGLENLLKLEKLAVHADNADDPNINEEDEEDASSEIENNKIYPTDNLITVGHIDGDAAILEVYVYNDEEESLYVHHDILLPSIPLCMEWLNYDAEDETLKPGNLVAIGSMSPIIDVWDLDVIDCLEPAYTLGQKPKKKIPRVGHSDAVLCLGWNKDLDHILASGSADKSIIIWDLQECKEGQKFSEFTGAVQDLKWHPKENHFLLAGSCDKTVKLFDCLSNKNSKSWKLDGEVESVVWDPCVNPSFNFVAGTDKGSVYVIDSRQGKPLQKIEAHEQCCSGIVMNSKLPGCLVTASEDKLVKVWDLHHQPSAKLIDIQKFNIGLIHSVSCSPDSPFVLSLGGNNKVENFKVWDMRTSKKVRRGFEDRLGLPVSDGEEEEEEDDNEAVEGNSSLNYFGKSASTTSSNWKPRKKSKKKKGGHLDRLNR